MLALVLALSALVSSADVSAGVEAPLPPVRYIPPKLDPTKDQLARSIAARLLPPGTISEWFKSNIGVGTLVHQYLMTPVERFAQEHGAKLPEEGIKGPPVVRMRLLEILDPASRQRITIADPVIRRMAAEAAATREPQYREALAIAYGQRLSVSELQALDRFLSTPEGTAFARNMWLVQNDFGVFAAQQIMDKAVVDAVPAMTEQLDKATASLPKVKDWSDLNDAERKEVAKLLNVDPRTIK